MRSLIKTRCIVDGGARGGVLFSPDPIAFLRGVDPKMGFITDSKSPIFKKRFTGKILVFPNSVGSSVGAYVIYELKRNKVAPLAMINQSSDIITASGCAIAGIPLCDLREGSIEELKDLGKISIQREGISAI